MTAVIRRSSVAETFVRAYIIRRLLFFIPVLLAASIITFLALRLVPGDPAVTFLGQQARPEEIERWHEDHGTNKPLIEQYLRWLGGMLRGDPGETLAGGQSIGSEIKARFPVTGMILVFSFTVTMFFGVAFGIIAAVFQDSPLDYIVRVLSVFGQSVPSFFLLTLLILIPAMLWRYSPPFGYVPFWEDPWRALRQVVPPTFVLAIGSAATLMRLTRSSLLEVLRADYVRTARAKGLRERPVIIRHCVRNALLPVVTIAGIVLADIATGSFFVETIYQVPGVGRYFVQSITGRDYPVILGTVLLLGTVVSVMNLIVDLLYPLLDPRISSN